jgi:hypothetical protein
VPAAPSSRRTRPAVFTRTPWTPTRTGGCPCPWQPRKRIKEANGWLKTVALMRKTRHRGVARVGWMFTLCAVVSNLIRLPKLLVTG